MAAAAGSRSSSPDGNLRSFLYGPGVRILAGVGLGYVSQRLWAGSQVALDSKLAQLDAVPNVAFSTVHSRQIPPEGELVLLHNSVVRRDDTWSVDCRIDSWPRWIYKPQGLVVVEAAPYKRLLPDPCVYVKNVDADHLPLEIRNRDAPGRWTRSVTKETMLRWNVLGRLSRNDKGVIEIEPCNEFPKDCLTKRRSEIESAVRAQAQTDPNTVRARTWTFGTGLVSAGFILSAIYSYALYAIN